MQIFRIFMKLYFVQSIIYLYYSYFKINITNILFPSVLYKYIKDIIETNIWLIIVIKKQKNHATSSTEPTKSTGAGKKKIKEKIRSELCRNGKRTVGIKTVPSTRSFEVGEFQNRSAIE